MVYALFMNCCSLSLFLSLADLVVVPVCTASRSAEDKVDPVASAKRLEMSQYYKQKSLVVIP